MFLMCVQLQEQCKRRIASKPRHPPRPKGAGWLSKVSPQQSESKQTDAADDRSLDTASMLRLRRRRSAATEEQYPMWVVPLHHFLALKHLKPHAQMRAERKLVQWTGEMKEEGTVIYISHQWTAFVHPDHSGKQLRSLQRMLERMVMGRARAAFCASNRGVAIETREITYLSKSRTADSFLASALCGGAIGKPDFGFSARVCVYATSGLALGKCMRRPTCPLF